MKLLAATNRYYVWLSAALFAVGSLGLYVGITHAFRHEVEEQLAGQQQELLACQATGQPLLGFGNQLSLSARPRPLGYSDTLLADPVEGTQVPHRQLTFRAGGQWVTLRRSLVETNDLLAVVLGSMLALLGLLLAGIVGLHRYLARQLWAPFRHTLAALRRYDLARHQPLALPAPAIEEFAELNQALNHLSERLVADYSTLRKFTANAAHETQTPLAIMQAQLEQLLQLPALATDPQTASRCCTACCTTPSGTTCPAATCRCASRPGSSKSATPARRWRATRPGFSSGFASTTRLTTRRGWG